MTRSWGHTSLHVLPTVSKKYLDQWSGRPQTYVVRSDTGCNMFVRSDTQCTMWSKTVCMKSEFMASMITMISLGNNKTSWSTGLASSQLGHCVGRIQRRKNWNIDLFNRLLSYQCVLRGMCSATHIACADAQGKSWRSKLGHTCMVLPCMAQAHWTLWVVKWGTNVHWHVCTFNNDKSRISFVHRHCHAHT